MPDASENLKFLIMQLLHHVILLTFISTHAIVDSKIDNLTSIQFEKKL